MAKSELIHRSGVLLKPEQLETGAPSGQDELELPQRLILEFCASLIREVHSPDLLWIAADIAKKRCGATGEQRDLLLAYIYRLKRARR
tara:strand:+ start:431 stop:694 length:264 start_codon:yes stop_codon:yes gene_type:complete